MKRQKGAALAMVIIAFAVLMILGTMVLSISMSEANFVSADEVKLKELYTARSGAEAMVSYLIENPNQIQNIIDETAINPAKGKLNNIEFEVVVKNNVANPIVESKVIKDGNVKSEISIVLNSSQFNFLDYSVFSTNTPTIGKQHNGNVGTNSNTINRVGGSKDQINGNARIVNGNVSSVQSEFTGTITNDTEVVALPQIDTSKFTTVLADNSRYNLTNGDTVYLNATSLSRNFSVTGNGILHLLVSNLGGNIDISVGANVRLILYSTQSSITFNGNPTLPCIIYAPNAIVSFNGGGNGTVNSGQIICKQYEAPNSAAFNYVGIDTVGIDLSIDQSALSYTRGEYDGQ